MADRNESQKNVQQMTVIFDILYTIKIEHSLILWDANKHRQFFVQR
jgi:hypothetical protein